MKGRKRTTWRITILVDSDQRMVRSVLSDCVRAIEATENHYQAPPETRRSYEPHGDEFTVKHTIQTRVPDIATKRQMRIVAERTTFTPKGD